MTSPTTGHRDPAFQLPRSQYQYSFGAAQQNTTGPDQHHSIFESFALSSHDQSGAESTYRPQNEYKVPGIGSVGCCKWCQRLFLSFSELEEHEKSTDPVQRPDATWVWCVPKKSHGESNSDGGDNDHLDATKQTEGKSSPGHTREEASRKFLTITQNTSHTNDNPSERGGVNVSDANKDRSSLRSASIASYHVFERTLDEEHVGDYVESGQSQSESDSESENDDLGDLVGSQPHDLTASLYGTSMPKASFLGSLSHRGRPTATTDFWKKGSPKVFSPRTFQTAQSSLASYSTAPSGSFGIWKIGNDHGNRRDTIRKHWQRAEADLLEIVVTRVLSFATSSAIGFSRRERMKLNNFIELGLSSVFQLASESMVNIQYDQYKEHVNLCVHELVGQLVGYRVGESKRFDLDGEGARSTLRNDIAKDVVSFLEKSNTYERVAVTSEVFSSEWLDYLRTRGILLDPMEELDWSGKGQHVEYSLEDEGNIPLTSERILGHSQTAIVDSVKCRRIRLARKKILCNRRLKKEDAITEVEHLLRLQHAHIVRVVGTYTIKKDLAILLYPAAEMDLDAYMDGVLDDSDMSAPFASQEVFSESATHTIMTFFGCLSNAIAFIHGQNVKHMDIKPKNILVRRTKSGPNKVYIADFGIARSYTSAAESETDSPVSFTRTYAAPEVVLQDRRGFSADVFSLGCVFMEMMATLRSLSTDACDERQALLELRQNNSGSSAYYANINVVTQWYKETIMTELASWKYGVLGAQTKIVDLCPQMIVEVSSLRPLYAKLKDDTVGLSCLECNKGPEPFEAAE